MKNQASKQTNSVYDVAVCGGGFAGISAAVAAAMTDDFTTLDVKALQTVLQENGVVIHEKDLFC